MEMQREKNNERIKLSRILGQYQKVKGTCTWNIRKRKQEQSKRNTWRNKGQEFSKVNDRDTKL